MAEARAAERQKAEAAMAKTEKEELRALLESKKVDTKVRPSWPSLGCMVYVCGSVWKVVDALIDHGCTSAKLFLSTAR